VVLFGDGARVQLCLKFTRPKPATRGRIGGILGVRFAFGTAAHKSKPLPFDGGAILDAKPVGPPADGGPRPSPFKACPLQ